MSDQEDDPGAEASAVVVTLSACDIPEAELTEPLDKHPVAVLGGLQ